MKVGVLLPGSVSFPRFPPTQGELVEEGTHDQLLQIKDGHDVGEIAQPPGGSLGRLILSTCFFLGTWGTEIWRFLTY